MRDGVINILKPPGMTSSDVVCDVRRILHIKRVGHTGTLDPGACGVLPIAIGRATRLFDYLLEKEKEYIAEVTFGTATDTLDAYGTVTERSSFLVNKETLVAVFPSFTGEIEQTAPMYSAVSVGGQRLYKLARKGLEVERKTRRVYIHSLDIITQPKENVFLLRIRCSKGTYVRTLCADIAKSIGTCAYVSFLLRSESGRFCLYNSVTLDELKNAVDEGREDDYIMPSDEAIDFMPQIRLSGNLVLRKKLVNGADVECDCEERVRVYYDDEFIGIGECSDGRLHIKAQFCED